MYSIIIVEDEYATRNALTNIIHWEEFGFVVTEVLTNGKEALEYLKKGNNPDVILTDIEMPNGNGLEIASFVKKYHLDTKIVFLTGYRDFSYAQKAVEYGVEKYLLKPINPSKIKDAFNEIRDKLEEQRNKEELRRSNEKHYNEIVDYEKQQLVSDLFFGALTKETDIEKRVQLLHLQKESKNSNKLVLVKIKMIANQQYITYTQSFGITELQEQLIQIFNCFSENVEFYPIEWTGGGDEPVSVQGVFWLSNYPDIKPLCSDEISKLVYNLTELQAEVGYLEELEGFYHLAQRSKHIVAKKTDDITFKDSEYRQLISDQRRLLCSYLYQNNVEQGMELTETLVHNYLSNGVVFAQKYCIDTIVHLIDEMWEGDDAEIRDKIYEQCIDNTVLASMTQEILLSWMNGCIRRIFEERGKNRFKQESSLDKVMEFIRAHYTEDITLSQIAENVYMNPSYISRMVKVQTGKNITDLITEMRMEKAIALLRTTDLKIYKIAEKVGYTNLQYFYRMFRKITGKSPSDFRM